MNYIYRFLRIICPKFKVSFLLFFFFTLISVLFETFSLAALFPILEYFSSSEKIFFEGRTDFIFKFISNIEVLNYEKIVILIIFITFVTKNFFLIFYQYWQSVFTLKIERFLASELYKIYLHKDMMFYLKTHSGTLIRNMSVEIKNVTKSISSLLVLIIEILMILVLVFILLYVSPIETFFTLLIIGSSGFLIIYYTNKKVKVLSEKRAEVDQGYNKNLIDSFNSINDIKLMNKINFFSVIHDKLKDRYFDNLKKFSLINAVPRPSIEIVVICVIVVFVYFSLSRNLDINEIITTIGLFGIVGLRLLPAFSRIVVSFQSLKFRYISFRILYNELIQKNVDVKKYHNKKHKKNLFLKKISFKNVSFRYDNKVIFENFNFEIKKNRFLFIYGESGSGKSTLLNLLMGLIKPTDGTIVLDNEDNILKYETNWRNIVSYVPQQIYLLDDNIEKNIAFGEEAKDIDHARLKKVIQLSKLENFLIKDDLSEHNLGEKGIKISGGQIQRIGVARALYRNPKVLLLDESTNGLDYETEKKFLNDLSELKKDLTIVFVSHREHIKDYADDFLEIKKIK